MIKTSESQKSKQRSAGAWKRWTMIAVCFILIAIRWIWPTAQVDSTTIWLVAIAALLFVLPDLRAFAPYIKRIKIGDAELELKEQIGKLDSEVQKARDAASSREEAEPDVKAADTISSEIDRVIEESSRDPRAALLLLSSKIEQRLRNRLEEAGLRVNRNHSGVRLVEFGVHEGIFPQEFLSAFRDFWTVRNKVAHGAAFDVDDSYILSLISLGTELLQALTSSFKKEDRL
jgi:hypothetical protein